MVFAFRLVEVDKGLGLGVIGLDAVADGGVGSIIGAAFDCGPAGYAPVDFLIGNHDGDDSGYAFAAGGNDLVENFCLRNRAGIAVQKEAVHVLYGVENILNHTLHNLVRNEIAGVDQLFRPDSEGSAGGNFSAEQFSGGNVPEIEFMCYRSGVGAFARSRRTEKNVVFHWSNT